MTSCFVDIFYADSTAVQWHHCQIGQKKNEKIIEKIMLKDAQYISGICNIWLLKKKMFSELKFELYLSDAQHLQSKTK
jgi:hypothetical protein